MINIEHTEEEYFVHVELMLRGLKDIEGPAIQYCEAFDDFVDHSPVGDRIGDQPKNVRQVWEEAFESSVGGPDHDLHTGKS